ncbi:MAG TPA: phosphoribosylglycinamide formyltransferase [Bacteroidales bacterium]|nr:phosphoribosylglycinamide formyltransferase [Bacteroidales bacterium]HRZ75929.1 phosphoribosylglycinamide formyltransferase [Bacteroidales bacterium]
MKRIAILASGNGSNAQRITEYLREEQLAEIGCIISNRREAFVLQRAARLGVHAALFPSSAFRHGEEVLAFLREMRIDFIALAGFLLLVPENILQAYARRIVNVHPALLPDYGGKGMYGMRVHEAVIAAGEAWSGITIHHVSPAYDEGQVIFQARCSVESHDSPESLAEKVHLLEYAHYPRVIGELLSTL